MEKPIPRNSKATPKDLPHEGTKIPGRKRIETGLEGEGPPEPQPSRLAGRLALQAD